ncbi:MAG: hypothetical protein P4N60_14170, partial [Verrucomicrobiae bacterium]|nr:hypothetical protein [Verrucomicrobiae bacterium]
PATFSICDGRFMMAKRRGWLAWLTSVASESGVAAAALPPQSMTRAGYAVSSGSLDHHEMVVPPPLICHQSSPESLTVNHANHAKSRWLRFSKKVNENGKIKPN